MNRWVLFNTRGVVSLVHQDLESREQFHCGDVRLDTPPELVLEWIAEHEMQPWDVVQFPDGAQLHVMKGAWS